jgi:LCP family protein required for cell wall assembly
VPPGRAAARKAQKRPRSRILRIVCWTAAVVLVVTGGGAAYLYVHLAGNIKTEASYAGTNKAQAVGTEKADPLGRTPLNIVLIGSDTRDSKADCKLGGGCEDAQGARADVEMVVHLSADRSNISVMSIPRDLKTALPTCAGGGTGMINSSLGGGPGCTDTAIHKLTGIPIDGFAMVDFGGVIDMSNALGGVNLCFTHRVYDIDSGLKLTAGTHELKGQAALEFLRTRHGFGDGSDNVARTSATHVFFTAMIDKLKSAGTLTDLPAMYSIANAATKSLKVSDNLDTPLKLINFAGGLNKVPTNRITFTTMQNADDTTDGQVHAVPDAQLLFNAIADDQSLTTASGKASGAGAASATPAPQPAGIAVAVWNGTGLGNRAGEVVAALVKDGFSQSSTANSSDARPTTSSLTYGPGDKAEAQVVANTLGLPSKEVGQGSTPGLKLVIGADWKSGTTFPGSKPSPAPLDTEATLAGTHVQNGSKNKGCVLVSTDQTENKLGLSGGATLSSPPETPEQMFDLYPKVPMSAP